MAASRRVPSVREAELHVLDDVAHAHARLQRRRQCPRSVRCVTSHAACVLCEAHARSAAEPAARRQCDCNPGAAHRGARDRCALRRLLQRTQEVRSPLNARPRPVRPPRAPAAARIAYGTLTCRIEIHAACNTVKRTCRCLVCAQAACCMPRTCRSAGARDSSSAAAELASMTPPYSAKKTNVPAHAPRLPRADASDASRRDASERACAPSRSRRLPTGSRRQSQGSCEPRPRRRRGMAEGCGGAWGGVL
jgi:hypothetical protein